MATRRSKQTRLQQPTTPLTANELFLDAMVRHQIGLLRVSGGISRRVIELLDASEADLRGRIRSARRTGLQTEAQVRSMERLLEDLRKIRNSAWDDAEALWFKELTAVTLAEPKFVDGIFKTVMPVTFRTRLPTAEFLRSIVRTLPFQGANLKRQISRLRVSDLRRMEDQVRIGLAQAESLPAISRRLVGSVRLRGTNGVAQITRQQATMLTRTATSAFTNSATKAWALKNKDIISRDLFVATLDSRTTKICASLDGRTFPIDQPFPVLPLHFGERSRRVPMADANVLGKRPMKPITERQLLREYSKSIGIDPPSKRAGLPFGTKGKFDAFARKRVREIIGRVPAKVSFQKFLERQSAAFQDDYLGKVKGRLFRRGGLEMPAFVDRRGLEKSLADLAIDEPAAFRAIGLDPEDFF